MKYFIYIITVYISIFSCFSQKEQKKTGTTYLRYKPYNLKYIPSLKILNLNNDNTYNYKYQTGFHKEYSIGTWKKDSKNKKIILIGILSSTDSIPLNLIEASTDSNFVRIDFNAFDDDIVEWKIVLNEKEYPIELNSSIKIENIINVDSLYIKGYKDPYYIAPYLKQINIRSLTYYPKEKSNYFKISFPPEIDYNIFYYVPLQDTLKIKGDKLIWKKKGWKKTNKFRKNNSLLEFD